MKEITFIVKCKVSDSPFVDSSESNNEKILCLMENMAISEGFEIADSEIIENNMKVAA